MNELGPDGIRELAAKLDAVPELTSLSLRSTRSLAGWGGGGGGGVGGGESGVAWRWVRVYISWGCVPLNTSAP